MLFGMTLTWAEFVGGCVLLLTVAALDYSAIVQGTPAALTAITNLAMFAAGYFFRAKLQTPNPDPGPGPVGPRP